MNTGSRMIQILIVSKDAHYLTDSQEAEDHQLISERVDSLSAACTRIQAGGIKAILLDLSLPDSQGIDSFKQMFTVAPRIPIMILCSEGDVALAKQSLSLGARGYLVKGSFTGNLLAQSLQQMVIWRAAVDSFESSQTRAETTLNLIIDAVIGADLQGNVDYMNPAAEKMTGWPRDQAQGRPIDQIMPLVRGTPPAVTENPVRLVLQQGQPVAMNPGTILLRRDASTVAIEDSVAPIMDSGGHISGAVIVFHEVTAARALALDMAHFAQHDALTQLPNQVLLADRIVQAISLADRDSSSLAVLFLDLDNFKQINDSLGHVIGDKLLQSVAQRLSACVRNSDTVSRNGGDEFVVLLAQSRDAQDAAMTAQKILLALAAPHNIDEQHLRVTSSIGISVYPADALSARALIKKADRAMYHAKQTGRNNYQFFKHDMNVHALERKKIESSLRQALQQEEFTMVYQPRINLQTGAITGAEALLRWQHPKWGMTLPERFVTVAEECGLILPIGRWILREACLQARRWQDEGLALGSIAVNISALEFCDSDFVSTVRTILRETGLDPALLQLDIAESVLMQDAESSTDTLKQLKKLGVQLALDDFGTGYSNLSYLLKLPIDVLKIDHSFVHTIHGRNGSSRGASAVIAMAASFGCKVVAEGVETQEQLDFLRHQCCNEGQGYLFSCGVDSAAFTKLLGQNLIASPNAQISAANP